MVSVNEMGMMTTIHGGDTSVYAHWYGADGSIQWCKDKMPPHQTENFDTYEALVARMSEISDIWDEIVEEW